MPKTTKADQAKGEKEVKEIPKNLEEENQSLRARLAEEMLEKLLNNPTQLTQETFLSTQRILQEIQLCKEENQKEMEKLKLGINQIIDFLNSHESKDEEESKEEEL